MNDRHPVRTVKFDQSSSLAILPEMLWSGAVPLNVAIAQHVTINARFKRGEWFIHVDPDQSGGHLFFRGRKTVLKFTVEGKPWLRSV